MLKAIAKLALCCIVLSTCTDLNAEDVVIRIRIVNGKTGKPITNTFLNLWNVVDGKNDKKEVTELATDSTGTILVRMNRNDSFSVIPGNNFDCRRSKGGYPGGLPLGIDYSASEILKNGITGTNLCGKTSIFANPGELIFFERPLTFWEGMRL
jgi:hypothetical protein